MSHILTLRGTGQPIAYFPKLGKYIGCVKAGIFLGQMVFWSDKTDNPLGVYKTSEQIEDETGLTYREQASARKKLVSLGLISETYKRLDHRLYFKFNETRFDEWLSEVILANAQTVSSPTDESAVREQTKAQFVTTENTTEITTDTHTQENTPDSENQDGWNPDLNFLKTILAQTKFSQRADEIINLPDFKFHLGNFNAHWENKIGLTENQRTRKFAAWLVQEFEKQLVSAERQSRKPMSKQSATKNRNVNAAWVDQPQITGAAQQVEIPEGFV